MPFTPRRGSPLDCDAGPLPVPALCHARTYRNEWSSILSYIIREVDTHRENSDGAFMTSLAHVNIRTADLEASVAFYRDVLGLAPGPAATRPGSADHVWMSDEEGCPCVHLQRTAAGPEDPREHAGMHHLALLCSNPNEWRQKLRSMGIDYSEAQFAAARMIQLNLKDPDGVRLELLFENQ